MDPIYHELARLQEKQAPFAFAVLVEAKGSTPQKAGAKAIFLPDGQVIGTLGGGCLEAETRQKALRALDSGEPLLFRAVLDDDFGWDDGLICGGSVQIFIQPNPGSHQLFRQLVEGPARRARQLLATIVTSNSPRHNGSRALFTTCRKGDLPNDVIAITTLGDAGLGEDVLSGVQETARAWLDQVEPKPGLVEIPGQGTVYLEPILPPPILLVCGGGHVGGAIGKLAAWCGFEVVAMDDRKAFANKDRFPEAKQIIVEDPATAVKNFALDRDTYVVLVTRGHKHDALILREVIHSPAAYIGMIGSRRKLRTIMTGFIKEGVATAEDFRRIHSPMGVPINSESVEEIAVSVMAEMIAVRRGKTGLPTLSATGNFTANERE